MSDSPKRIFPEGMSVQKQNNLLREAFDDYVYSGAKTIGDVVLERLAVPHPRIYAHNTDCEGDKDASV